jgi:hypothetical protein
MVEDEGCIGEIVSDASSPPITRDAWIALTDAHPNLARPQFERQLPNPFKPGTTLEIPRNHSYANVVVGGNEVGTMNWSEDDSNLIEVWGDATFPLAIAREVAARLGGRFIAAPWVGG